MNILIASHGFPPNQTAGAEWRTYRTARWLAQHGYNVQVVAVDATNHLPYNETRLTNERVDGLRVRRLSYFMPAEMLTRAEFDNPIVHKTLTDLFATDSVDLLHLISGYRMSGSAIQAATANQIPTVVTLTDFWFLCPLIVLRRNSGELCRIPEDPMDCTICLLNERRRYRLPYRATGGKTGEWLKRFWRRTRFMGFGSVRYLNDMLVARRQFLTECLRKVDKIIAPSEFIAKLFEMHGVPSRQLALIRQGCNLIAQPSPKEYVPSKPLVFGYIGQLASHKGILVLVKAFHRLSCTADDARLIIYGDSAKAWPPFLRELKSVIGDDKRIVLAGSFPNQEAQRYYAGLDVLVVPSIWYENSPNVILEAFASGIPVMASNLGGMAELVQHGVNGCLFDPNSVSSLQSALEFIMANPRVLVDWRRQIPQVKSVDEEMRELEVVYRTVSERKQQQMTCSTL